MKVTLLAIALVAGTDEVFHLDLDEEEPDDDATPWRPTAPTSPPPVKPTWGHSRNRSISVEGLDLSASPPFAAASSPSQSTGLLDLKHHFHNTASTSPSGASFLKAHHLPQPPPPAPLEIDAHAPWAHSDRAASPPLFPAAPISPRLTASHPGVEVHASPNRRRGIDIPEMPLHGDQSSLNPLLTHVRRSSAGTNSPRMLASSPAHSPGVSSPSPPQLNGFHLPPPAPVASTSTSPGGTTILGAPSGGIALRRRASVESGPRERRTGSPHGRPRSVSPRRSHSADGTMPASARRSPQSPEMRISPSAAAHHSFYDDQHHPQGFTIGPPKRSSYEDLANAQTGDSPPPGTVMRNKSAHLAMPPPSGWELSDDVDESGSDDASGTSGSDRDGDEMDEDAQAEVEDGWRSGPTKGRREDGQVEEDDDSSAPWGPLVEGGPSGSFASPQWPPPRPEAPFDRPLPVDTGNGESLTMLEHIFIFSKSEWREHRVLVSRCLADWMEEVDVCDALEYIFPLLNSLAGDEDEVKLGLAHNLDRIMWYFYSRCPVAELHPEEESTPMDVDATEEPMSTDAIPAGPAKRPRLSGVAFVPLLGLLLMEPVSNVIAASRLAVVRFLCRLNDKPPPPDPSSEPREPADMATWSNLTQSTPHEHVDYDFDADARGYLEAQILTDVVIGLAHLEPDSDHASQDTAVPMEDVRASRTAAQTVMSPEPEDAGDDWIDEDEGFEESQQTRPARSSDETSPDWGEPLSRVSNSRGYEKAPSLGSGDIDEVTSGKVAALELCAALAIHPESLSPNGLESKILPETVRLASDAHPSVRAAAVCALGYLAAALPEAIVVRQVIPPFEALALDEVIEVRRMTCLALTGVCTGLSADVRRARIIWAVRRFASDHSRVIRIALATLSGQLFHALHLVESAIPTELVDFYLGRHGAPPSTALPPTAVEDKPFVPLATTLSSAASIESASPSLASSDFLVRISREPPDAERTAIIAFNFPAVVVSLGGARWPELRELHADLARSIDERVRRSIAASLHEVARIVGSEAAARDLAGHFERFVGDANEDVRAAALANACNLVAALPADHGRDVLYAYTSAMFSSSDPPPTKTWRQREEAAKALHVLASHYAADDPTGSPFHAILVRLVRDPTASVRAAAIEAVPDIYAALAEQEVARKRFIVTLADIFAQDASFRHRTSFVSIIRAVAASAAATPALIEADLLPALATLALDPIVDVRIAVAREASVLARTVYSAARPSLLENVLRRLASDTSATVRTYVAAFVDHDPPPPPSASLASTSSARDPPHRPSPLPSPSGALRSPSTDLEEDDVLEDVQDDKLSASALRDLDDGLFGSSPPTNGRSTSLAGAEDNFDVVSP